MKSPQYLLGYDIGSSSIKATLLHVQSGVSVAAAHSPKQELHIDSPKAGWAEQQPDTWWEHLVKATRSMLQRSDINPAGISAIGISYQMHGLVAVDKKQQVLRPSIIWCDSRATEVGSKALSALGSQFCLDHYLNSPGNFTASKLKWVMDNEPELYSRIDKIMLPGDYIAMKLTGEITTTISGLSEGIFWDFKQESVAEDLLDFYGIAKEILPEALPSFSVSGTLSKQASETLGLVPGIPVSYRAGDQPNNALALNVLEPGEAATTAGTSGVIYGVTDQKSYDEKSRVNSFAHVNHSSTSPRYGVLLCINGTGILYRWLKQQLFSNSSTTYKDMNQMATQAPPGADGLNILPFGNGAERILGNRNPGSTVTGLDFNRHTKHHLLRAALEGVIFSMKYGLRIMNDMGIELNTVKAGHANLFLNPLFRELFVNINNIPLDLFETSGAEGAARGAGIGAGIYTSKQDAFSSLKRIIQIEPDTKNVELYREIWESWYEQLTIIIKS